MAKKSFAQIKKELLYGLAVNRRLTKHPIIVALAGITGVGNSTVARTLGKMLGWTVIEKNKIRVRLREEGPGFSARNTSGAVEVLSREILLRGGNLILDSDAVEREKRKKLEALAKKSGARVVYLHLTCDRDIMIARILRANYDPRKDIFKNAAVALREHCRRYPLHYRWSPARGGSYTQRKLPIKFFAEIDTTISKNWQKKIRGLAKQLKRL